MNPRLNTLAHLFSAVSLLGFLDALYLTMKHYLGTTVPCSLTQGCETVLTSEYAVIAGVPVALIGAAYYLSFCLLALVALQKKRPDLLRMLSWYSIGGVVASLWLVYLQAFVIQAFCLYCLVSAGTSTLLFLLGLRHLLRRPV